MGKPRLLDLGCRAGGASYGLMKAGFHVTGLDIKTQPHYIGDKFILGDMLTYPLEGYDAYWCSPPCQFGCRLTKTECKINHPNLIPAMQKRLRETGKPYLLENIPDNRKWLENPLMLCGTMFNLPLWRHRYFECQPAIYPLTMSCNHSFAPVLISGSPLRKGDRREPSAERRREAMQTPWMTCLEMDEAIPPVYAEFLGKYLMQAVMERKKR